MLRALQAFMFMITIVFADTLIDFEEWRSDFLKTLTEVLIFVAFTLILAKFLKNQVPLFLALMACPPHVNEENMNLLFDVLFNDHPLYSSVGENRTDSTEGDKRAAPTQLRGQERHTTKEPGLLRRSSRTRTWSPELGTLSHTNTLQQAQVSASGTTLELAELLGRREELEEYLRKLGYEPPQRLAPVRPSPSHSTSAPSTMFAI
jgi:hypothetical protein